MPKLKTNSSAKKRFSVTGTGKVKLTQSGKRHGMTKRSKRSIRNQRGMVIAHDCTAKIVKCYMPYSR